MLSEEEFDRLQKLACIKLNPKEKKKLWDQLVNIIDFLDKLKNINMSNVPLGESSKNDIKLKNSLRVISWTKWYDNIDLLLSNIKHNKVNNNIVIKSVLT